VADPAVGGDVKAATAAAGFLIFVAGMIGDETLSLLMSPLIVLAILYVLVRAPIRYSMLALMFVALTVENPDDNPGSGKFRSPFWGLGALLLTHLNKTVDIPLLGSLSGVDIILIVLLLVGWYRKQTRSSIDRAGRIETPEPLVKLALISLVGIVWILMVGLLRGGNFSMALWQIDKVIHLPVIFLLFHWGLRGPKDHVAVGRVVIGAAMSRAMLATYIDQTVVLPDDPYTGEPGKLAWATSHHDSILFALAFVICVALLMERATKSAKRLALLVMPILAMGMVSNHRRMVWVQVGMVFATLYFATPSSPAKRKVKITAFALSPLIAMYLAAGWESKAAIFKPVATIRSVVDPQTDASTLWREMENYDLLFTIKQYWVFGAGYGNGYWEVIPLPPIDYTLERYLPHNSILGLWCFAGVIGYTTITLLWGAGVYFAMRSYFASKKPTDRVAALACMGAVLVYMIQCYGDVGLGSWTGVFSVGAAIAVAGKLAVSVGAWPSKEKKKAAPVRVEPSYQGQVA
jgi:hypothetical protein